MSLQTYPTLPGLTFTVVRTSEFDTNVQSAPNKIEIGIPQTTNPFWHWTLVYDVLRNSPTVLFPTVSELRTLMGFYNAMYGRSQAFLYVDPTDNSVGPAMLTTTFLNNTYYQANTGILDSNGHWQKVTVAGTTQLLGVPTWSTSGGTTTSGTCTFIDMGDWHTTGFPNLLAQVPIVTDGAGNWYSPIQRSLGGLDYEDITDLTSALAVYLDGNLQGAGGSYTLLGPGFAIPGYTFMGMYIKWTATGTTAPGTYATIQCNFAFRVCFEMDSQDFEQFTQFLWTIGGSEGQNGKGNIKLCTRRPILA